VKRGRALYLWECELFRFINGQFERKKWNSFFHFCTHLGSASFTIAVTLGFLCLSLFSSSNIGFEMATALFLSHLPVATIKKIYPRKRPYLVLPESKVMENPLHDHSFPSGHTTAIFSIVTPLILYLPILAIILVPLAIFVGTSRVFLGLHYPSDVLAGACLGSATGLLSVFMI